MFGRVLLININNVRCKPYLEGMDCVELRETGRSPDLFGPVLESQDLGCRFGDRMIIAGISI